MSQIAQLSETEIEARFHIVGQRPVAFTLDGFAREKTGFSVQFDHGGEMFLTTLLAVLPEKRMLIFDCSGSPEINRRFLQSERSIFVAQPGGIHVQFVGGQAREVLYGGSRAFAIALPDRMVRLQRREFFRIDTPRVKPLQFYGRLPGGGLLALAAHDISVAGIGLGAAVLSDDLVSGLVLSTCHFSLPEDKHDLLFSATVRHITEQDARGGFRQWRLGLQFNDLPRPAEARVQRYITHLERERHELS